VAHKLIPHINAFEIRMAHKVNPKEVKSLAFIEIGPRKLGREGRNSGFIPWDPHF
jgi:hypothetical protein